MAIVQISKIQVKTGNIADLPQLSTGEFGYATDSKQLFIGNDPNVVGSIPDNTEILTTSSVIPAPGYNTQVLFNDGGSLGAAAGLTYNKISDTVGISGNIIPVSNGVSSLGNATNQWADMWISGNTIYMENVPLTMAANSNLQVNGSNVLTVLPNGLASATSITFGNITSNNVSIANNIDIGGNLTINGNITANGNINVINGNSGQFFGNVVTGANALYAGVPVGYARVQETALQIAANFNGYMQLSAQNLNSGPQASFDVVITADNGTDTSNYIDMGIASSTWDGTQPDSLGNAVQPDDGYLYVDSGNLVIGTSTPGKTLNINIGASNNTGNVARFNSPTTVSTSSTSGSFTVVGGVGVTGNINSSGNVGAANITAASNVNAVNIIAANIGNSSSVLFGDGANITGLSAGYSNADVDNYLSSGTMTANIITSGNVTADTLILYGVTRDIGQQQPLLFQNNDGTIRGDISNLFYSSQTGLNSTESSLGNVRLDQAVTGQVVFAEPLNDVLTGDATFTFDPATGVLSVPRIAAANIGDFGSNIYGDGGNLSNIQGANVIGTFANANYAAYAGNITIANQSNITSVGTLTSLGVTGALTTRQITTGASGTTGSITGTWTLTAGSTLEATYADMAERYTSDRTYDSGTVLMIGGTAETTLATVEGKTRIAGIVSSEPAYILNSTLKDSVIIALIGRVPCKVIGTITKGDLLTISDTPGVATVAINPQCGTIIGRALESYDSTEVGMIEVKVDRG